MENCSHRLKGRLSKIVALIAIGIIAVFVVTERSRNRVALGELGRATAELRAQLEERDRLISSLQADLQQMQFQMRAAPESTRSKINSSDNTAESGLAQRIAELGVQQSNTAVVVERQVARIPDTDFPAQSAERSKALLPALEVSAQEEQRKWELARQTAAELLTNLNVPPETAMIPPNQALDNERFVIRTLLRFDWTAFQHVWACWRPKKAGVTFWDHAGCATSIFHLNL